MKQNKSEDFKKTSVEKKLSVFFFISSLAGGGAERVMVEILHYINRSKIEPVLVLLYPYEDSPYRDDLSEDIKVIIAKRKSDSLFEKIKQFASFVRIVRREKPHLIFSMLTHNNIMAVLAGMFFRIKVIACEHNTLGEVIKTKEGAKILGFPVAPLVKVLYRFADRVIAVSWGIRDNLIEEFRIDGQKINVIYNPMDMHRISKLISEPIEHPFFESNIPVIMAMGRLVWQKGFDTLIKAFANVAKETNAGLIILGEGTEKEALQKLVMDMGIAGKVSFAGFQRNPYKYLSKADIFVLSSIHEGLPMVILEALACGVPIVSTDCKSGPREILQDGRCGLLVPVNDVKALSDAILRLLKDSSLRDKFCMLGKERAKDFSVENIIKQYESIVYKSLTSKDK